MSSAPAPLFRLAAALAALLLLPALARGGPDEGKWRRAVLLIDAGEIPFLLWTPEATEGEAKIRNGPETIVAPFKRRADEVVIDFPHFDSRITARVVGRGHLRGEWTKAAPDGGERVLPFRAAPVDRPAARYRFPGDPQYDRGRGVEHADIGGEWKMKFSKSGIAKGVFRQERNIFLNGTILTPTGDYRYLAGAVQGERFNLSVFDGAHAFLFTGEQNLESQTLSGEFYSGNHWRETFTATRAGGDFELPGAFSQVSIQSSDGRLRLPALDDPQYDGKPVIVTVFGTWCPNCHDEAPALVDLYERYSDDGLRMLGLAYEHNGSDARAKRQIERFKERYGIDWEIKLAGESDKQKASASLPAVSSIKSFPTTIFVNRDGTVRAIHSGFSGPATGEKHEDLLAEFERLTREIVGSEG